MMSELGNSVAPLSPMLISILATVPLSTFETNTVTFGVLACSPITVISHGPSRSVASFSSLTSRPSGLITNSDPDDGMVVPFVVGRLPTSTKPFLSTASAVVRPRFCPWKKVTGLPSVTSLTMVVPVPCLFDGALKLDTRTSPGISVVEGGTPLGTKAMPYGLRSPLVGTVAATVDDGGRIGSPRAMEDPNDNTTRPIPHTAPGKCRGMKRDGRPSFDEGIT